MTRNAALIAGGALTLLLAATFGWTMLAGSGDLAGCRNSRVAGAGDIGGPFTLTDETGAEVTEAEVITGPTLVYFGYTFCPDVCPIDASRNALATDLLAERGITLTPVFITIDPNRDTPEVLADFTDALHPRMLGLTGTEAQIADAARVYRTTYGRADDDPDYYLMNHMNFSYLMLPEHGFAEFYRGDISAEAMADSVACFVEAA